MDAAGLVRVDEQLDSFVGEVFSSLARKDRRATAGLYVRGLMLDGRRKSMYEVRESDFACTVGVNMKRSRRKPRLLGCTSLRKLGVATVTTHSAFIN